MDGDRLLLGTLPLCCIEITGKVYRECIFSYSNFTVAWIRIFLKKIYISAYKDELTIYGIGDIYTLDSMMR